LDIAEFLNEVPEIDLRKSTLSNTDENDINDK